MPKEHNEKTSGDCLSRRPMTDTFWRETLLRKTEAELRYCRRSVGLIISNMASLGITASWREASEKSACLLVAEHGRGTLQAAKSLGEKPHHAAVRHHLAAFSHDCA